MFKIKKMATLLAATTLFTMLSALPTSAYATEKFEYDPVLEQTITPRDIYITGDAISGVGNTWYIEKSSNVFTETWVEYWNYDGTAGVGWVSYNRSMDADRIKVHHNTNSHCGYVQNRNTMTGAWTNTKDATEWTNIASIDHGSGTIRYWFFN